MMFCIKKITIIIHAFFMVFFCFSATAQSFHLGADQRLIPVLNIIFSNKIAPLADIFFIDDQNLNGQESFDIILTEKRISPPESFDTILFLEERLGLFSSSAFSKGNFVTIYDFLRMSDVVIFADPVKNRSGRDALKALTGMGIRKQIDGKLLPIATVPKAVSLLQDRTAEMGMFYSTEAFPSLKNHLLAYFPEQAVQPISYYLWQLTPEGKIGYDFLISPVAVLFFRDHGFNVIVPRKAS